ncbi:MAG: FKBP-type peptidyl-prolyl cis-trans isomerase [Bacteroidota bacterium]|nr:FKBP-type peptidyl-prolyl cis-trans isomerase [Bacteroidota bacterium]
MKQNLIRITAIGAVMVVISSCGPKKSDDTMEAIADTTAATTITESAPAPAETFPTASGDTITTLSGLKYVITQQGTGPKPVTGKMVAVHYTGYLTDGTKFDSSVDRGEPIKFPIGTGKVIKGWDEGIAMLNTGSKARLIIPSELGYGTEGYPPLIPASSTLIFDVELVASE